MLLIVLRATNVMILAMSVWTDMNTKALAQRFGAVALLDKMKLADDLIPACTRLGQQANAASSMTRRLPALGFFSTSLVCRLRVGLPTPLRMFRTSMNRRTALTLRPPERYLIVGCVPRLALEVLSLRPRTRIRRTKSPAYADSSERLNRISREESYTC